MDFPEFIEFGEPPEWAETCTIALRIFSREGLHGALSGVFTVQFPPVAEESFICDRCDRHAGAGDWGDDRDLQPGECGVVETVALSGAGPADADHAGGPLDGSGRSRVAELSGLL